ncbi:30S ribosomal subunit protein S20 [Candidatus Tremblaya phenacola PAVE]|nr:30S ribosomal subunit protein S20 [Candidatus Tremblaya phenacola PAVE]
MGGRAQTRFQRRNKGVVVKKARNSSFKAKLSRSLGLLKDAIITGRPENECREEFGALAKMLDIISNKGIFHKNKAARYKRRMATLIRLREHN